MCGIAGSTEDSDGRVVQAMCARLRHRGPDDEGAHTDPATAVSIGIRRLAIMDVEGGHQPLCNEDRSVWVVCNGEIYNHPQLREDLRARGHRFGTGSDTEVLVHLYEEYGEDLVHALDGMFAFALWDERRGRLLLARDRFGEKPLFVHEHDRELTFASELTALLEVTPRARELDPAAIDAFFVFAYVPGPRTIVRGVRQLAPGHLLSWERDGACRERPWWTPGDDALAPRERLESVLAEARRLFDESVRRRMISDVPLGVFLSGGVDSTLVAISAARASSKRLRTFTVGYDVGSVNETAQARRTAAYLDSDHHEVTLTEQQVAERAPALLAGLDQPLADRALLPLNVLSEFARPRVTVALGGEGADELFGGYPRYRWLERSRQAESALPSAAARSLGALWRGGADRLGRGQLLARRLAPAPLLERNLDWVTAERRSRRRALYGPRLAGVGEGRVLADLGARAGELRCDGSSTVRWLMRLDQVDYLPDDVLFKTDRAGMLASLEIRTVFLNRELADFAASLDTAVHLAGGGKALVRAMLPAGVIETPRVGRYRKTAFRVPAADWLRGPLAPVLDRQIEHGVIYSEGYFDRDAAGALVREHRSGAHDHSDQLWPLLSLGLWADRFHGLDGS
ncbi:MAG TPA: asparagine synthase (glutamine-hydrolyzing) [Solirubrobacteraceae bacterium]|jgi:asparagine synthase (glutamine-hydrolysing)|nr:asparagine synthase (glutamine-hydrolyzing) [Solirubrobacteraceae bacterium]